ncbi:DUF6666 family protein [Roseimaritima ulvae]|uniref:Uncharacterized protein n=1 Tax=Roseimaritima ulvae TaxID=980254 RepID=A0A5B9QTC9_9BACT|nr:DUF6666 family protein [Roseimaritima ulvae]QEG42274.1 hypothetical protein UC8_43080 [Roseimaritima ulvae]
MDWLSQAGWKRAGRLGVALAVTTLAITAWGDVANGQDRQPHASSQIDLSHARQVSRPASTESNPQQLVAQRSYPASQSQQPKPLFSSMGSQRKSALRRAAHGEVLAEPIPQGLVPASYYGEGPACGVEPGCGFEPACGCEGPVCGCEPTCGAEGYCDGLCGGGCGGIVEASCGAEGYYCNQPGCDSCGGVYLDASCGVEPSCGVGGPVAECVPLLLPILPIDWSRFEFFAGVQGFTGPPNFAAGDLLGDRSGAGSFGFHEGFNEGRSLRPLLGIDWAAQFGLRATQNNIEKTPFSSDQRNQIFLTAGLSRRVDYGLQVGVVFDYLNDDWYYHADLGQVRGELSWKTGTCHELGYRFMGGVTNSSSATRLIDAAGATQVGTLSLVATDQHRIFYRRDLGGDGSFDAFLGTTDSEDTLMGLTVNTPLRGRWGLRGGFVFLNPGDKTNTFGAHEESWNVSMSVVWRPGGKTGKCDGYYKPLFDVADNGSFMVDTQ